MATEDHSQFQFAAERYVLGELSEQETLAFEEHFFACGACAQDVEDLTRIREAAPAVLPQLIADDARQRKASGNRRLFGWWPQLAFGALPLLAVLTSYQNIIEIPRLKAMGESGFQVAPIPQQLTATRAGGTLKLSGKDHSVPLVIGNEWPDGYASYQAKIGKRGAADSVMTANFAGTNGALLVTVPAAKLGPGNFEITIFGNREHAEPKLVARYPFTIQETSTR